MTNRKPHLPPTPPDPLRPSPPRSYRGLLVAVLFGLVLSLVAALGITTWNTSQSLAGIKHLEANSRNENTSRLEQIQAQNQDLTNQIHVLEDQLNTANKSISDLSNALQSDVRQLENLGQQPSVTPPSSPSPKTTPKTTPSPQRPSNNAAPPNPDTTTTTVPPLIKLPPFTATDGFGCDAARAYLAAHAAPGFEVTCTPHSALGHYGYTCVNVSGVCPNAKTIHIACPYPFVYKNEASNSYVLTGQSSAPIDPYGQGDVVQDVICNTLYR